MMEKLIEIRSHVEKWWFEQAPKLNGIYMSEGAMFLDQWIFWFDFHKIIDHESVCSAKFYPWGLSSCSSLSTAELLPYLKEGETLDPLPPLQQESEASHWLPPFEADFGFTAPKRTRKKCPNPLFADHHLHRVAIMKHQHLGSEGDADPTGVKGWLAKHVCTECGHDFGVKGFYLDKEDGVRYGFENGVFTRHEESEVKNG